MVAGVAGTATNFPVRIPFDHHSGFRRMRRLSLLRFAGRISERRLTRSSRLVSLAHRVVVILKRRWNVGVRVLPLNVLIRRSAGDRARIVGMRGRVDSRRSGDRAAAVDRPIGSDRAPVLPMSACACAVPTDKIATLQIIEFSSESPYAPRPRIPAAAPSAERRVAQPQKMKMVHIDWTYWNCSSCRQHSKTRSGCCGAFSFSLRERLRVGDSSPLVQTAVCRKLSSQLELASFCTLQTSF